MTERLCMEVALCVAPREVVQFCLALPPGSAVALARQQALQCWREGGARGGESLAACWVWGVWGRAVADDYVLQPGDRLEAWRALQVDPKVARRERFARQGARTAGLFVRQRSGAKAGY